MFKRMQSMSMQAVHCFQTVGPNQQNYRAIIAIHNTQLGPALGGCRCLHYAHEQLAFDDAMRLAQGMSYKAALANVPHGGGKAVIILPSQVALKDIDRQFLFSWFGHCVEQLNGQYITAMDVGTQVEDMDVVAKQTCHVASASNIGDPAHSTALGVMAGIQAALDFRFQKQPHSSNVSMKWKRFAVQGLGHVGWRIAERLTELGAHVIAADPDEEKCHQGQALGMQIVPVDEILQQECDVLVPCALGGVIHDENVAQLKCSIIAGSANNQLAHDGIARQLKSRNILYAPDYIINAGGLIFASLCYQGQNNDFYTTPEVIDKKIRQKIEGIYTTLFEVFQQAKSSDRDINDVANELALQRLAGKRQGNNDDENKDKGAVYDAA